MRWPLSLSSCCGVGRRKVLPGASGGVSSLPPARTWIVQLFVLQTLLFNSFVVSEAKMFNISWNTTNEIFRIDNTDHIIDVNKGNKPYEYDQVNFICPVYNEKTPLEETERYMIYLVTKEEYETCRITNPNPRAIAVCDQPNKILFVTVTFRMFTPQPGGLEFQPGQDYYVISTSSKDDMHRRVGGRCLSDNMKLVFKVCCSQPANKTSVHTTSRPMSRPPPTTGSTTRWQAPSYTTPQYIPTRTPPRELPPKPTKKINEYDKHPNEVLKNEELTYSGAGATWHRWSQLLVVLLAASTHLVLMYSRR